MKINEETKKYVTPYAFGVSDAVLGKALASPLRRLCALLVDLIAVSLLTLMSTAVFAFVMLCVAVLAYFRAKARQASAAVQAGFVIFAACSALFLGGVLLFDEVNLNWASPDSSIAEVAVDEESLSKDAEQEDSVDRTDVSFITYIQTFLSDMGLGFGWAAVYFSVFGAWFNGQTIGKMMFRIKAIKIDGDSMSLWESFGRYGGYSAGLATGLMGFIQIFWDPNRQAIHDKISETVVLDLRKSDKEF